jgi:hypothetical protein
MRSLRPAIAALAATAALLLTVGVADAQQANNVTSDYECDTATGEWVFTITVENLLNEEADIVGTYETFVGGESTDSGDLSFVPDPLAALGTSVATVTAPGDTEVFEAVFDVVYEQFETPNEITIEIGETCEPPPTTTTTAPTTTTTEAASATATPRFTG